jgi:hypothetical protein
MVSLAGFVALEWQMRGGGEGGEFYELSDVSVPSPDTAAMPCRSSMSASV